MRELGEVPATKSRPVLFAWLDRESASRQRIISTGSGGWVSLGTSKPIQEGIALFHAVYHPRTYVPNALKAMLSQVNAITFEDQVPKQRKRLRFPSLYVGSPCNAIRMSHCGPGPQCPALARAKYCFHTRRETYLWKPATHGYHFEWHSPHLHKETTIRHLAILP